MKRPHQPLHPSPLCLLGDPRLAIDREEFPFNAPARARPLLAYIALRYEEQHPSRRRIDRIFVVRIWREAGTDGTIRGSIDDIVTLRQLVFGSAPELNENFLECLASPRVGGA